MKQTAIETPTASPKKRGRPKGSKNKKVVKCDTDDEEGLLTPGKRQKVVHTYGRTKFSDLSSPEESAGNVRKSSRIKAGIESGKITLATRIKLEGGEDDVEEEGDSHVTSTAKQVC